MRFHQGEIFSHVVVVVVVVASQMICGMAVEMNAPQKNEWGLSGRIISQNSRNETATASTFLLPTTKRTLRESRHTYYLL